MTDNEITESIQDSCFELHRDLGPGLFESVYECILATELRKKGLSVVSQLPLPVEWRGEFIHEGFKIDLLVENRVLVEIKSLERLAPVHAKQLLTYLRLSGRRVGLLVNFGEGLLKDGIKRLVNGYE